MATYRRNDELDGHLVGELLDDRAVEQLLAGRLGGELADLQALSSFVVALRSMPMTVPAVVRSELVAVFETGLISGEILPGVTDQPTSRTSRRQRMLETLSAFVATLTGKLVLGTAALAASVGGVHAAGVVDVPGLPDRGSAVVDVPAVVDGPADAADPAGGRPDVETGQPTDPGVDGSSVSDRATSGEPQEDGKAFGTSVADEATDGTPAEGIAGNGGDVAQRQPDSPGSGTDTADEYKPDTPAGRADTADEYKPENESGADTADEYRPDDAPTSRP
ncbi:MAG TPA: hypothetical protein VFZ63_15590 [Jiangellaceae bacterium]